MANILGKITWYRGDSFPLSITISDKSNQTPLDLTGYSFRMSVNVKQDPTDITDQIFTTNGIINTDPTTGIVSFTPTETDTDYPPGDYYYDIEMTDNNNNIRTIIKNKFKIVQDISK